MFKIRDGTLYKYTGNDKVVILPDEVEIIAQNAFDGNTNIEVIAGNKVKKLCYNSINTPNLKILKLPKVEEIEQLNDLKKIEYLKVNINTKFASIRYLNPNLKLELVLHGNESIIYTSNPSLLTKLDFVKDNQNFKEDFFLIVFNNKIKRFAINKKIENYTLFLNNISSVERFFNNIPNEFKEFINIVKEIKL